MAKGPRSNFSALGGSLPGDRSDIERVKDATDIVRLIGEHVALKAKGREFVGLCPFHDDHSPSMYVVPAKQFYKCFSCGAAGDAFAFVVNFHKMEFREALEYLAQRAGVPLTPRRGRHDEATASDGGQSFTKKDLLAANALATGFFQAIAQHPEHGAAARGVIARRGIAPDMVREFQLGAAPNRWDGLLLTAQGKGVSPQLLVAAGLAKARESGGVYDAFRNRLMFPICDRTGRVIAFGARRIDDDDEPKYLNSPETPLFNKSATLYAMHLALRAIQDTRTAIICEGYTDVIACHQAGFRNALATLGTALTPLHARELRLACDRVILLFDGDQAGLRATDRAAEVFFAQPIDVSVVTLSTHTDAKDPDELLKREGGAAIFRQALEGATDLLSYRFARVRERLANAGQAAIAKAMQEEVERLVDLGLASVEPIRRALIEKQLASIAGVPEATIRAAIPAGRSARRAPATSFAGPDAGGEGQPQSGVESVPLHLARLTTGEYLLGCLLCDGRLWAGLSEADKDLIGPFTFEHPLVRSVAQAIHDLGESGESPNLQGVSAHVGEDLETARAAVLLCERIDDKVGRDPTRLHRLWHDALALLRRDAAVGRHVPGSDASVPAPGGVPSTMLEAKPGASSGSAGAPTPGKGPAWMEHIETLRKLHKSAGPDNRTLPRPSG